MTIKAKKSLGQNFLFDKNILKIITNCAVIKGNSILEIGPGTGNLTTEIIKKKPKKFLLIEKDETLLLLLKKKYLEKITYINDDVLNVNENILSEDKLTVFGNLPYNISTEIICKWILKLEENFWFSELILMFQKEVADRIISKTNSSDYGRLSIFLNWKMNVEKVFDISPNCFYPKPKIQSTLIHFKPKKDYYRINKSKNLEMVTRIFFNQKRKKIKNPLKQLFVNYQEISEKLKLDLNLRPQNLSLESYCNIVKEYEELNS